MPTPMPSPIHAPLNRLRDLVAPQAVREGRTDSRYGGLRFYRFSAPTTYRKVQVLVPGVVVVLQGSKELLLADGKLRYDAAQCLVLGGEMLCRGTVVSASAGKPYLALHLDLPPEVLARAMATMAQVQGDAADAPRREAFVTAVPAEILDGLCRLLTACETELDRRTVAPLIVEEIALRLLRLDAAVGLRQAALASRATARVQQAMRYVREAFHEPITVDTLARRVHMSPSRFAHAFREVAGISPMRFLRDVRLDAARDLLLAGGKPSGVIGTEVGFESGAHFSREFKSRFEASPTDYVRRMKKI
jgi:AraC-like DNA-binding protein